jgi:hypothetical protein
VSDALGCESWNPYKRPCTEIDDLVSQAASEFDPPVRTGLYREIEERLFGIDGEFPVAPLLMPAMWVLSKPWINTVPGDGIFGGPHMDWITIDQEAQLAARGAAD